MPRPSNTKRRRSQIAEAMLTVMARDGYERASIAAIARAAELSPGLIHYHFRNKQEILLAVIAQIRKRIRTRYQARVQMLGEQPLEHLFAFVDAHVALGPDADERAVAAWVIIGAEAVSNPDIRAVYADAVTESLVELVRLSTLCLEHLERPVTDAERFAAAILAAMEGAYQLAAVAPNAVPRGFAAPTFRLMIRGMLGMPVEEQP